MFQFSAFHPRPLFRMDLSQYTPNDSGILIPVWRAIQSPPEYERRAQDSFVRWLVTGIGYWDEWKWKVVDFLMKGADVAVRFQWGHNAGHTVKVWDQEFDLHIIPSWLVHDDKEGIIARTCVLWVDLPKLLPRTVEDKATWEVQWKMFPKSKTGEIVCPHIFDALLKRNPNDTGKAVRTWLLPEITQLESKWKNVNGRLFIAEDVTLIGVHHVLIDAFLEQTREDNNLRPIGSTGSGISPAYATTPLRYNATLGTALRNPGEYFQSMRAEWTPYARFFPFISIDTLIEKQKEQIAILRTLCRQGKIQIGDEREKIDSLRKTWKTLVWEGAQGVLIGSDHSIYGTASSPTVSLFCAAIGIHPEEIANLFLTLKLPPSSVGTRALQFMQYTETQILASLRNKYKEYGVSTGRARDIMNISLIEVAEAVRLTLQWMPDCLGDRIVPVLNRVDWLTDFSRLSHWQIPLITGMESIKPALTGQWIYDIVESWLWQGQEITPKTLLQGYPSRWDWSSDYMFHGTRVSRQIEVWGDFWVTSENIWEAVHQIIQRILAALFTSEKSREVILGTSPERNGLVLARDISSRRT